MAYLKKAFLLSFALAACVSSQPQPEPSDPEVHADSNSIETLLESLPAESLHAALHHHLNPKFKHGIFEQDRNAVEAVHNIDPPLASKVIAAAKLDLLRRQGNSTGSPPPDSPPPDTSPTPPPTNPPDSSVPGDGGVVIPIDISNTDAAGNPTNIQTSVVAEPSLSVAVPVTTTDASGNVLTTSALAPAAAITTTDAAGNLITTTSPVASYSPAAPTGFTTTDGSGATVVVSNVRPGQAITTTNARGQTFVTTYTPAGGVISSIVLQTSTMPDGSVSVFTSYTVIGGRASAPTGEAGAGATNAPGTPRLQGGSAKGVEVKRGLMALAGAVMYLAWGI